MVFELVHRHGDRRGPAQDFGIRAGLVSCFHDGLSSGAVSSGELRMQIQR
jgi:hypothetical protein